MVGSKDVANWHTQRLDITYKNKVWRVQHLILLVNYPMFPEFLISGGIMFLILVPRYLKLSRPLLTVLIGLVVCD